MDDPQISPDLILANLSWPEVRDILDQVDLVLLPVGSNEQHGPNLALSMDIVGAFEFCRHVSRRLYPRVLVAPPMPWGVSFHHMNFPGTITLASDTFTQVLVEVVASLRAHGFQRFMIVNGHGGNINAMATACARIHEEIDVAFIGAATYFSFADREINEQFGITGQIGHACEMEVSTALYFAPHIVKTNALAAGDMTDLTFGFRKQMARYGVTVPFRFDEYTRNGALGDARNASLAYGTALMESAIANFVEFVDEIITVSPLEGEL
ncbi:MAG: creatininase [Chloroflexi bacterium]|nr:MAG: creatininase [Chloroflexota bacterium]